MFKFLFGKKEKILHTSNESRNIPIDTNATDELYDYIEKYAGISLQESKILVKNHLIEICEQNSFKSFHELLQKIKNDTALFDSVVEAVTIHETYFYREKQQIIEALEEYKRSDNLSILSIPCSSGEEVYSIAILALEMGFKNFSITGIDISAQVIDKANKGIYSKRSVGFLDQKIKEKYFIKEDEKYILKNNVKEHALFAQCNIFEDDIYKIGKFDLIFSRNMFIYFNDTKKIEAYKRLEKLKKDNHSSIYLGHADTSSKLLQYILTSKKAKIH